MGEARDTQENYWHQRGRESFQCQCHLLVDSCNISLLPPLHHGAAYLPLLQLQGKDIAFSVKIINIFLLQAHPWKEIIQETKDANKASFKCDEGKVYLELGEIDVDVEELAECAEKHTSKEDIQIDMNTEKKGSENENQEKVDVINDEQLAENTGPKEESI